MATFRNVRTALKVYSMEFDDEGMPGVRVVDLHPVVLDFTLNKDEVDRTRFAVDPDDT